MQKGELTATFNKLSASYYQNRIGVTLGMVGLVGGILIHAPLAVVFGAAAVAHFGVRTFAGPPTIPQKIGDQMPDGTIYAGISPETKQPMYTTPPADALVTGTSDEAKKYAAKLDLYGPHQNWRLPTKADLLNIFPPAKKP